MAKLLEGKSAVVAGGGRGIGKEICLALARYGADVVVNDYGTELNGSNPTGDTANALVEEIRSAGGTAVASFASVADFAATKEIINTCVENFGKIDILVNCATIHRGGQLWETSEEDMNAVFDVTLKGTMNTCTHALQVMMEQGTGRIINFTSPSWLGVTGADTYTAAKGAIVSLSRGIASAMKMANLKITCNAIAPVARTRLNTSVPMMWEQLYHAGIINRQLFEDSADPPTPDEIPPVVLYLASDQAEHISGKVFGASKGRIALYSEPQEIKGIYKEGVWTLEELMTLMPRTLEPDI